MIALIAAFQFLTISPPLIRRAFTPTELGRAVGYFPLVGLALGGLLYGASLALTYAFGSTIAAALTLALWVLLTRALHLDGLMDSCDGLFGGFTPERRLEIMRDSRVGAFGAIGGTLMLLAQFAALYTILPSPPALILAPVIGRWVVALSVVIFPYARESGLGRDMKDKAGSPQALIASLIAVAAAWLLAGIPGLLTMVAASIVLLAGAWFTLRRIPGLTGDIYGALCILTELMVLLVFSARWIGA